MKIRHTFILLLVGLAISFSCQTSFGQNVFAPTMRYNSRTGWYPYVIARGEDRALIQSMPMEMRPNRPLHFWGNSVRRTYYRDAAVPMFVGSQRGSFAIRRR
jgi:hypothetical protein